MYYLQSSERKLLFLFPHMINPVKIKLLTMDQATSIENNPDSVTCAQVHIAHPYLNSNL